MKLKKRLLAVTVAAMMGVGGVGSLQAYSIGEGATMDDDGWQIGQGVTVSTATYTNVSLRTEQGDYYEMIIDIDIDTDGQITDVQVNGDEVDYEEGEECYYEVDETGDYTVRVTDDSGRVTTKTIHVTVSQGNPPNVSLSKTKKNGIWYMVITYSDDQRGATSLTVNGNSLPCDALGDTVSYEINSSGNYEVIVSNRQGLQTRKTLYFDTDTYDNDSSNSRPTLSLSKKNRDGSWYLCIKAYDNDDDIKKVTVNGDKISFDEDGGTEEYKVNESRTYEVVVTDYNGNTTSDKLYIDIDVNDTAPSLSLSEEYRNGTPYIIIKSYDNNKISEVLVNDSRISFPEDGGSVEYRAQQGLSYVVESIDNNDHVTKKSIYIQPSTSYSVTTPVYTSSIQTVTFTLNSRTWYKGGVAQSDMDTAPCMINNRVCLPLRYVAYALGLQQNNITWDSSTRTAVIVDGSNTLRVTLGSRTMCVNGSPMNTDTAATMVNNHIYIPISQISKAFADRQINMNWDNTLKQVTISSKAD